MSQVDIDSFWAEGPERLRDALETRRAEIDELFERWHRASSASERVEIEAELRAIFDEYHPAPGEIEHALFLLG